MRFLGYLKQLQLSDSPLLAVLPCGRLERSEESAERGTGHRFDFVAVLGGKEWESLFCIIRLLIARCARHKRPRVPPLSRGGVRGLDGNARTGSRARRAGDSHHRAGAPHGA